MPPAAAASRSSRLAARISGVRSSSTSAAASNAPFFAPVDAVPSTRDAAFARRPSSVTAAVGIAGVYPLTVRSSSGVSDLPAAPQDRDSGLNRPAGAADHHRRELIRTRGRRWIRRSSFLDRRPPARRRASGADGRSPRRGRAPTRGRGATGVDTDRRPRRLRRRRSAAAAEIDEIEALHDEVVRATAACDGSLPGSKARRQLRAALKHEDRALRQIGCSSYTDFAQLARTAGLGLELGM